MSKVHPWLANHPDAIVWPKSKAEMTPEFIEQVKAVTSRSALLDIARACLKVQEDQEELEAKQQQNSAQNEAD